MEPTVSLLGIRHHGPGCARSLLRALDELQPDLILLEGPPDGQDILALAADPAMRPPVAQFIYCAEDLSRAVFYPFTVYSPEWQAIRFGHERAVPVRLFDLPQQHRLALDAEPAAEAEPPAELDDAQARPADPMGLLARAAGFDDGERWWEHMVETRQDGLELFTAIQEAMTALRGSLEAEAGPPARLEQLREAHMRRALRAARKEGFQRIAVVCGAWHVPALADVSIKAGHDNELLKGLPKTKVIATWVPWSYGRIASSSGYGAGVDAPGWYEHLWRAERAQDRAREVTVGWLQRVAGLLREEGLDVSTAHVIEGVRLAETLAALRDIPLPGLEELNEAVIGTFCFGDTGPLELVYRKLIVGERLGAVPESIPLTPVQQDLEALQRRLRLKPEAVERVLELDLRKDNDLERSKLLHRLGLLGIPWGQPLASRGKGTFKEAWQLRWQPEFVLALVEASQWGATVADAASSRACRDLEAAAALAEVTGLLETLLLADLPAAVGAAVAQLEARAAVAADAAQLMDALPSLANALRYGSVREGDSSVLGHVFAGFVARISVGLIHACASLDDDAAEAMSGRIARVHGAIKLLADEAYLEPWREALARLARQAGLHGRVAGKAYRLLLDEGLIQREEAARQLSLVLSLGGDPARGAAWIEGFLAGSGLLLLHDDAIWNVLDAWLCGLSEERFQAVLPLVRRSFAGFSAAERRQMGEKARHGGAGARPTVISDLDMEAAEAGLPLLARILGLSLPETNQ